MPHAELAALSLRPITSATQLLASLNALQRPQPTTDKFYFDVDADLCGGRDKVAWLVRDALGWVNKIEWEGHSKLVLTASLGPIYGAAVAGIKDALREGLRDWKEVSKVRNRMNIEMISKKTGWSKQPDQSWATPESADDLTFPRTVILEVADSQQLDNAMRKIEIFLGPEYGVNLALLLDIDYHPLESEHFKAHFRQFYLRHGKVTQLHHPNSTFSINTLLPTPFPTVEVSIDALSNTNLPLALSEYNVDRQSQSQRSASKMCWRVQEGIEEERARYKRDEANTTRERDEDVPNFLEKDDEEAAESVPRVSENPPDGGEDRAGGEEAFGGVELEGILGSDGAGVRVRSEGAGTASAGAGVKPKSPKAKVPRQRGARKPLVFQFDSKKREQAYSKRRATMLNKARELITVTGAQVLVLTITSAGTAMIFGTKDLKELFSSGTGAAFLRDSLTLSKTKVTQDAPRPPAATAEEDVLGLSEASVVQKEQPRPRKAAKGLKEPRPMILTQVEVISDLSGEEDEDEDAEDEDEGGDDEEEDDEEVEEGSGN
ncbi:hypothetical protein P7C70_g1626, partial [Phenoliferia sp. Uapishka_3]